MNKADALIIASDHTRPVPSKAIIPEMLRRLRKNNPDIKITILIATGCHRETTREELIDKFGREIVKNENIVVHDSRDAKMLKSIGTLPSGGELQINKLAAEASLVVAIHRTPLFCRFFRRQKERSARNSFRRERDGEPLC